MIVSTASQVYTVGCGSPFVSLFPHWHRLPRIALTPAAPTLPVTRKTGPKAAATPTPGADVKFAVEHGLAGLTTYLDVWKRELQVEMASMTRAIESLGTRLDRMERKTDAIVGRAGGDVAAAKK